MTKVKVVIAAVLAVFLSFLGAGAALATPPAPTQEKPVVDTTGTFTGVDIQVISNNAANRPEDPEVAQIAVLFTNKVGSLGLEEEARQVADKWGLGSKKRKNGILVFVAKDDRKMRIEVASGIGPSVTDTFTKRVINDVMKPKFKENKYAEGVSEAVKELRKAAKNPDYAASFEPEPIDFSGIFTGILTILAGIFSAIAAFFLGSRVFKRVKSNRERKELTAIVNNYLNAGAYIRDVAFIKSANESLKTDIHNLTEALHNYKAQARGIQPSYWEGVSLKRQAANKLESAKAIADKVTRLNSSNEKTLIKKWKGSPSKAPAGLRSKITQEQSRRSSYDSGYTSGYVGGYSSSGHSSSSSFDSGSSFGGGGGFDGGGSSGSW